MQSSIPDNIPLTLDQTSNQKDLRILAGGAGITAAGTLTGRLIHVLTDIWLARLLGPAWFGIYSIGWNLHRLLGSIFSLGLPSGVLLFGVKYWKKETDKLSAIYLVSLAAMLVSGGVSLVILWSASDWLALTVFSKAEAAQAIKTVGLVMPFLLVLLVASSFTRVTQRMQFAVISSELVTTISMVVVFALIYWFTGQFWAVLASMVVSYILAAGVCLVFVRLLFPELKWPDRAIWAPTTRELFAFSFPTMLAGAFGITDSWLNRLLTGVFFPAAQVGIYQAASQFNNLFAILMGSVVSAFSPFIASYYQSGQKDRLNELYKVTTKWSLYVNLPIVIAAFLLPTEILNFFYGSGYTQGAGLLIILTIGQLINVGTGATGGMFIMTGRQRQFLVLTIVSFCVNIFGSILLIPYLGISAMAVGQLMASLVDNIIGTLWLAKNLDIFPYDWRYLKGLAASLGMAALIWLLPSLKLSSQLDLFYRTGFGLLAFIAILLLLGLDHEDRTFLSELWRMLTQRLIPGSRAGGGK